MRSLGAYANIIPVIAKSDTLGEAELKAFKAQVRHSLWPPHRHARAHTYTDTHARIHVHIHRHTRTYIAHAH
jgi:hypothetical protein